MRLDIAGFAVRNWQFTLVAFGLLVMLGVNALLTTPRSEDPHAILAAIKAGAAGSGGNATVEVVPDRKAAIDKAVGMAGPGDVVVVAGKGHEQGQEVDGVVHPFDDRAVLRELILDGAGAGAADTEHRP